MNGRIRSVTAVVVLAVARTLALKTRGFNSKQVLLVPWFQHNCISLHSAYLYQIAQLCYIGGEGWGGGERIEIPADSFCHQA